MTREQQEAYELRLLLTQERTDARDSLLAFTQYTKPDYEVNWHHRVVCDKLDAFARGEIKFLMLFMPPRTGKSELVSRRLPAYLMGRNPDAQILAASYSSGLASEMTADVQKIMDSDEYREVFPEAVIVPGGRKSPGVTRSSRGHDLVGRKGKYRGAGVGGSFTGKGAHYIIVDDPIKNQAEADSEVYREKAWKFYTSTLRSRLEKGGQVLITLTRWHKDDLAGRIEKEMRGNPEFDRFQIVNFPMIAEHRSDQEKEELSEHGYDFSLDPREPGEPLWPKKYDEAACKSLKASAGSRVWNALYQQRPADAEGAIIKRAWLRYYSQMPDVSEMKKMIISLDARFKDSVTTGDYVVFQVWGKIGADKYLLDQIRDRLSFIDTCKALKSLVQKWPRARWRYVENKANGPAIENLLKKTVTGIILVEPEGSKSARLEAVSPQFESGNVYLPAPELAPWIGDYIEELVNFPTEAHDDQVDATSQALLKLEDPRDNTLKDMVTI